MTTHSTILLLLLTSTLVFIGNTISQKAQIKYHTFSGLDRPPLLKPLTRIAGTSLFLNKPYKWHDRSRQSCYATRIGDHCNIWVACAQDDKHRYYTRDASFVFERTDGSDQIYEYHGAVKIRNLATNFYIGHGFPASTFVCLYPEKYKEWYLRTDPSNIKNFAFEVNDKRNNHWLSQVKIEDSPNSLWLERGRSRIYPYSFVAELKLEGNMYDFNFFEPLLGTIKADKIERKLIKSYIIFIRNPSKQTAVTIAVSEKIRNEIDWNFPELFKIFAKVDGTTSIPLGDDDKFETSFQFTQTENLETWKTSPEKTLSMSYTAIVPPYQPVEVFATYDLIKDITLEFTSKIEITGKGTRITYFNEYADNSPATGEKIREYLEFTKLDVKILQIKKNSVIAMVTGTMVASLGLEGQLNVDGKVVATKSFNS